MREVEPLSRTLFGKLPLAPRLLDRRRDLCLDWGYGYEPLVTGGVKCTLVSESGLFFQGSGRVRVVALLREDWTSWLTPLLPLLGSSYDITNHH